VRIWGVALVLAAGVLTGCSTEEPEPVPAPPLPSSTEATPQAFDPDPELAPALAVLALVPTDATSLAVTDFDRVRLQLGESLLTGASPPAQRAAFWRRAEAEAPLLSPGRLRPLDSRLARDHGFTQDDVAWEASFTGPAGDGWVARLRDGLDLTGVRRAVAEGVGPLAGSELDEDARLLSVGAAAAGGSSWAADEDLAGLVSGAAANATYVSRTCVPLELPPGAELEELTAWSVSFGGSLATARLGPARTDVFARVRLPAADAGRALTQGVGDPVGGRIGYTMADPPLAARLALAGRLPFAACAG
jgi:hypothetical protein